MQAILSPTAASEARTRWAGRALTAVPALFLAVDVLVKVVRAPVAVDSTVQLGLSERLVAPIGWLELACLTLYVVPRTAFLGAVLLTGFLGGAVAMQLRMGNPLATHTLFPVYVAVLCWAGLALRDARLRALVLH